MCHIPILQSNNLTRPLITILIAMTLYKVTWGYCIIHKERTKSAESFSIRIALRDGSWLIVRNLANQKRGCEWRRTLLVEAFLLSSMSFLCSKPLIFLAAKFLRSLGFKTAANFNEQILAELRYAEIMNYDWLVYKKSCDY